MKTVFACATTLGVSLLLVGSAWADSVSDSCEKLKSDVAKWKDDCPDEHLAAEKIVCKTKDDLNAMLKVHKTCGEKKVAKATAPKDASAASDKKCRATLPDGTTVIAEETGKLMDCLKKLKEKVTTDKCTGDTKTFEYLTQTEVVDKWTKGTKAKVTCPKKP
jgi:hypothetical protein